MATVKSDQPAKPRPRPAVTRDDLGAAALAILERDGLKGLTMRRVAEEVGVQAASLYWHVRGKEELFDLATDALWRSIDLTDVIEEGLEWRELFTRAARRVRAQLLTRPAAARLIAGRFSPGPSLLGPMEVSLALLRGAGVSGPDAALAVYAVVTWVQGFVLQEAVPMSAAEQRGATPTEAAALIAANLEALPRERYPNIVELAGELAGRTMEERFEFGLARILDGIATRIGADGPTADGMAADGPGAGGTAPRPPAG